MVSAVDGAGTPGEEPTRRAGGPSGDDPGLSRFLDALQAPTEREASSPAAARTVRAAPPASPGAPAPPRIPGYEVGEVIGKGGMGIVYRARQVGLDRMVALKMVRSGAGAGEEERARFHAEAEAAARLQHPNIIQIHEVGQAEGQPWFSMELVEGGSWARRLATGPVEPREAATLVRVLAQAMDWAHARGVVHRDLKPANVLLTLDGTPRIGDFGLAKRMEDDRGLTGTGVFLGTPGYMAPEQARGDSRKVGPPADIYALGAILYESLTGRPPFQAENPLDVVALLLREEPVPPRRLRPEVDRDLETICLKCLEKDPRRRYASAGDLAEDLRRLLEHESIRARPSTALERGLKWARRRPALAALLLVSAAAVLGFLIYGHLTNARLEESAMRTRRSLRVALNTLNSMLIQVKEVELSSPARTRQLRERTLEEVRELARALLDEEDRGPEALEARSRIGARMAEIHRLLGDHPEAEKGYRAVLEALEALAAARPAEILHREELAATRMDLGMVLQEMGRLEESGAAHRRALQEWEAIAATHPLRPAAPLQTALVLQNLGLCLQGLGRSAEAEASLRRSLEGLQALLAAPSPPPRARKELGQVRINLAPLLYRTGRTGEAIAVLEEAARDFARCPDPTALEIRELESLAHGNLGGVYSGIGRTDDAEASYRKALSLQESLALENPGAPRHRLHAVLSRSNLGRTLLGAGRAAEAEEVWKGGVAMARSLAEELPDSPEHVSALAALLQSMAGAATRGGRMEEARTLLAEAATRMERLVAAHPDAPQHRSGLARTRALLGASLAAGGRRDEADAHFQAALALQERLVAEHPQDVVHLFHLGETHHHRGDHAAGAGVAERFARRAAGNGPLLYAAAGQLASCAMQASSDPRLGEEERRKAADGHARRAVELLREAFRAGYANLPVLKTDPSAAPLRAREDFQTLLAEMEAAVR